MQHLKKLAPPLTETKPVVWAGLMLLAGLALTWMLVAQIQHRIHSEAAERFNLRLATLALAAKTQLQTPLSAPSSLPADPAQWDALLAPVVAAAAGQIDFELAQAPAGTSADGAPQPVFSSPAAPGAVPLAARTFQSETRWDAAGRTWLLRAGASQQFMDQIDHSTAPMAGVAGVLLGLALSGAFWLLLTGREHARATANAMTQDVGRLAQIVQSTTHLVIAGDTDRNIMWVNAAFTQFTGIPLERALGRKLRDLMQLDGAASTSTAALVEALGRQEPLRVEMPLQGPGGQVRWFDVDLQIERDRHGLYAGYIVIAADVTAQHDSAEQIAQVLRENQALMAAIDEHSIVSLTDQAGKILYANAMFERISGYSQRELLGNTHRIVKSAHQDDAFWSAMWKTIASGYTWRDTVCNRAKDGTHYWVDTVIAPIMNASGSIDKYVSIRTDVTAARQAQAELKDEREHLQAILQGTNAGTWEWEVPTGRNIINERWAEIIGYTQAELGEITIDVWRRLCHPADMAASNAILERHFSGEIDYFEREFRMRHRAGHWVWVQSRGRVSKWLSPGKPLWVSGIHLDVSAQKLLQSELAQNNRVMQSILDNVPMALSVFDSKLHLIAHNRQFQELLDFPDWLFEQPVTTFEELIRFNAARGEYGSKDVEETVAAIVARARNTDYHQFERERPNGVALEVRGAPMPGGGFITTYADISVRRQAEAEIARSNNMLQSVLNSASEVAVVTIDPNGIIALFNKGAERMFGCPAHEVVGICGPEAFFDPDELQARNSALSAQLGRPIEGLGCMVDEAVLGKRNEWTYVHRDGHRFTAALVVTALTDNQGKRTGYLGVSHDITQEKEHEARLQIAMERAEQASTAKGQFLANMSHEIRTPMNAILGMLKLLQYTTLDPRQQDYATKTESAARSLLGLLNDILDFSKSEAGKMELDPQPFRLDLVMRDLSVILSANVGARNIEVLFDLDPQIPDALIGDSLRLQQVLINLGGNAIKFTERGEVVVKICLLARTASAARIHVAVRDSGIGIDPKNQQHIFLGFSQAEASTTRRFGGTGLGLSICRRLIDMMGGELRLDSALGQGSTFHFDIELPIDTRVTAEPPERTGAPRVLVVDDNPVALGLITGMAQSLGWNVEAAANGAAALERVGACTGDGQGALDAIVLDWRMNEPGGSALVRQLRAQGGGTAMRIIATVSAQEREALSSVAMTDDARLDGFLVKPMTASMLQDAYRESLGASNAADDTPAFVERRNRRPRRLVGLRILLVEDNAINQQVARELLSLEGAHIDLASNGQLGVDAVARANPPYDAVLMDLQMPVMDGFTAAVTIRHDLGMTRLPIIAMTANAMSSDREACLAAGMNDHIGKPFDLPQLVAMLCRHTGHDPASGTVNSTSATSQNALMATQSGPSSTPEPLRPTMDVAGAMALLGDNQDLYVQITQAFQEEVRSLTGQLEALLDRSDLSEARRLLHTFKGLSLTVGALALSDACRTAEAQLKPAADGTLTLAPGVMDAIRSSMRASTEDTLRALDAVLQEMAPASGAGEPAPGLQVLDTAQLAQDLQLLEQLLSASDMRAVEVHSDVRQRHGAAGERLDALQAAMHSFDFGQGVVQCRALIRELSDNN